jgi:hypothetical protein
MTAGWRPTRTGQLSDVRRPAYDDVFGRSDR